MSTGTARSFLQLSTGMRIGELATLNVGHVLHAGTLRRQFQLERAGIRHGQPRTIYLENERANAALMAYLRNRRPTLDYDPDEPLFAGQKPNAHGGYRLAPNALAHLFEKLYLDAGVIGASSDSGRRWFIIQLARAGVHPKIIQRRAGHASINTTRRHLADVRREDRRAVHAIEF